MKLFIKVIVDVLILSLFLYSKLLPYKDKLHKPYKAVFYFFYHFYNPIFNLLKRYIKPIEVGKGIAVDFTQIIVLILLLIFNL